LIKVLKFKRSTDILCLLKPKFSLDFFQKQKEREFFPQKKDFSRFLKNSIEIELQNLYYTGAFYTEIQVIYPNCISPLLINITPPQKTGLAAVNSCKRNLPPLVLFNNQ